jgi:putative phosphoesterase
MRVAVVSDVHGNLAALERVVRDLERRGVDEVVHGGDLALMGSAPAAVVDRIRELGWRGVVGNTEELLWRPEGRAEQRERAPRLAAWIDLLFDEFAPHTRALLGEERIAWLRALPAVVEAGGIAIMHATPGDLWRAPMPEADDAELAAAYGELRPAVAYGHIHRPYVRRVDGLTVANSGSVGLPWDRDPRASYLIVADGDPEIVRVEYDVEREARALRATGHPEAERLAAMRREARFVRDPLPGQRQRG